MSSVTRRRTSVFAVAMTLLAGLAVVGAPAALAHHPEIAVTTSCDIATGGPVLSVTANSWSFVPSDAGNHDDVRMQMRRLKPDGTWTGWVHEIGNGAFVPGNRSFVRNFDAESVMADFGTLGSMVGQTVQVRLHLEDTVLDDPDLSAGWYTDSLEYPPTSSGNSNPLAYSGQFVIPGGCEPATVSVGVTGSCTTGEGGEAMGELTVSIAPDSGATVTVNGVAYTTSQASIPVAPGSYPWLAVAADGFVLEGEASGTAVVVDCSEPTTTTTTTPPSTTSTTSTTIAVQNVTITMSCPPAGSSTPQATVVPAGGATVELLSVGNGVFTWKAQANPGYAISGSATGVYDTTPCAKVLGEVITTSTTTSTTVAAVAADQLPFTGFELDRTVIFGLSTLIAGMGLLVMASRRKDEAPVVETDTWSD
jgi:hypothetical protein